MFLKLKDKSFIKEGPDLDSYMPYINNTRDSTLLNKSASKILKLCDGTNSLNDIINLLRKEYNEKLDIVKSNVENFLNPLISCGLIEKLNQKTPSNIKRGSSSIYYPDVIIWEITNFCPLRCRHCYLAKKNNQIVSKDNIDKILKIIDYIGVCQVQLTGGEALTHPLLGYIIDKLINKGIVISISTSGMILEEKVFNHIKKINQVKGSFIRISLDGNKQTHNYIRQNESSYDNAIKFIKRAINNNIPCQVGTTIINQSKDEIEQLVKLSKKLGVSLIEIGMLCIQGDAKKNNLNSFINTKELNTFLKELHNKYSDNKFTVKVPISLNQRNCGAGHKLIRIRPNMDITPCPMLDFIIGNLNSQNISEIMSKYGKIFHDFYSPQPDICLDCNKKDDCNGCSAHALTLKDEIKNCSWCEKQQKNLQSFFKV